MPNETARALVSYLSSTFGDLGALAYSPNDLSISKFKEMLNDSTVAAGYDFLRFTVLSRVGEYTNAEDPEIEEFVREQIDRLSGAFELTLSDIFTAVWAGVSVTEMVLRPITEGKWAGKVGFQALHTIDPATIQPRGFKMSDNGWQIESVSQRVGAKSVELPGENLIVWSHDAAFGNPWGSSIFRAFYKNYFTKDFAIRVWGIFLERYAMPILRGAAPPGNSLCPIHNQEESNTLILREVLEQLLTKAVLVLPKSPDPGQDQEAALPHVDFLEPARRGDAGEYLTSIRYHDGEILKRMLIPRLVLEEAQMGTRAQATVHLEAFMLRLQYYLAILKAVLEEGIIRRLIQINFANPTDYGEWRFAPISESDISQWADVIFKLTSAGFMSPAEPTHRDFVAETLHLPAAAEPEGEAQ